MTKKALPIFEELVELYKEDARKDWHGDSAIFTKMWKRMGEPKTETVYKGIRIQMRPYQQYVKGSGPKFCVNALGPAGKRGIV